MNHKDHKDHKGRAFLRELCVLCGSVFLLLMFTITASAQVSQGWPTEDPPRPLKARDVKFPPYQTETLPNGLKVVVVLHHEQPAVSMRLLVRAGSALDPKDKLGLARMAASLLTDGTTTKTAEELADFIDFIGGAMGSGAGTDLSYINMVVMKDSFETGLAVLSDMARHPAFAQSDIERERQQSLSGLQVSLQDPDYVANAVFDRLVYGFHPYGLPQTGTPETIAAITRQDLTVFHERYFAPNNAILAIVGDVTADEALASAKKVFGDWQRKDVPPATFIAPPDPTRRVVIVNKPDAVQTEVRVGHIGVPRKSSDYMALNIAIRILGGEGSNRLHQVLRTERGLTYGAEADFDTLKEAGDFEAQTNTRSDATGEVVRLIVDEFWRLQRERVSQRELEGAKAYLTGSFPLTIETPDQIAMQVLNHVFYDLPLEELQDFRERVNAITVDDIQRVARTYLKPDRLSVVLVGNASAFTSQLKELGFANYEVVDLTDLDLTAADLRHDGSRTGHQPQGQVGQLGRVGQVGWVGHVGPVGQAGPEGQVTRERLAGQAMPVGIDPRIGRSSVPPVFRPGFTAYTPASQQATQPPTQQPRPQPPPQITPEEGPRAKALLDEVIAAKGGVDKLRSIKTITAVTQTTINSPRGQQQADTTTYLEYPDKFRVEATLPTGTIIQVFDGTHAWLKDPTGIHDAPEPVAHEFEASLKRDLVTLLLGAVDGTVKARVLPDSKDETGKVHHALELSGQGFEPTIIYIDPDTHLISKQAYVVNAPGQPLIEESFSDYRPVNGVQIAWVATVRRGGQQAALTRRVTDLKINAPVDATLFKRPAS